MTCAAKTKGCLFLNKNDLQKTSRWALGGFGLACLSVALVGCLGIGIATAANGVSLDIDTFGISESNTPGASASESAAGDSLSDKTTDASATATSRLTSASSRNISKATGAIDAEREAARIAAEEAQRVEDAERSAAAQAHRDSQYASDSGATATGLSEVDWNVSKAEFIEQWGSRIDAYLAGSTLSGYGTTFAEAAWDAGIDPRFSPAISNTESTKGQNCFRSHNAWGWMGNTSWNSWEEAIAAHAQGLANGYGYTISLANASKYCPPTYEDWYQKTLAQMQQI